MAFINEPIPEEDRARLNMKEIAGNLPPVLHPRDWTVDRRRSAYLIFIPILGIPDDLDERRFIFGWNGKNISVRLRWSFISGNIKAGKKHEITWHEHPNAPLPFGNFTDLPPDALLAFREALMVYSNEIAPTEVKFSF